MDKQQFFTEGLKSPFSDAFEDTWVMWKQFRWLEHKFTYRNPISEQAALNELVDLSEGDEEHAMRIVNRSISRNWKGFYKVHNPKKDKKDGESTEGKSSAKKGTRKPTIDDLKVAYSRPTGTEG